MKVISATILAAVIAATKVYAVASSVGYRWEIIDGIGIHCVVINLSDPNVRITPAIAEKGRGSSESCGSFIRRTNPTAAITGTFFDTKSFVPVGDICIGGVMLHQGHLNKGICVSKENKVKFMERGFIFSWPENGNVLCSGPRLLTDGKVTLDPKTEGFRDPGLFKKSRRAALGVTKENKLILATVNTPVYLSTLAKMLQKVGCVDAINLDGGTSSALYYRGKMLTNPGRRLTNMLLVYDERSLYEQHFVQLAPTWFKNQEVQHNAIARGLTPVP